MHHPQPLSSVPRSLDTGERSGALPLPPPPPRPSAAVPAPAANDRCGIEGARADTSKVKALREYRRACGLCFKCGERWGHDHTCPAMVQLHVVEELLELFGLDSVFDGEQQPPAEAVMSISKHALTGDKSPKAFQLHAWLQGHEILMLVDSGSSTSFVDAQLATQLKGVTPLARAGRVKVAGGGELQCTATIQNCKWASQGHEFTTDFKVLPLGMYHAILGMDWLEEHSPMTVDWKGKHISIPEAAGIVHLHGHPSTPSCEVINSMQLNSLCRQGAVSHMVQLYQVALGTGEEQEVTPECIRAVLEQYPDVFGEPTGLPPKCSCDHHIPLVPVLSLSTFGRIDTRRSTRLRSRNRWLNCSGRE